MAANIATPLHTPTHKGETSKAHERRTRTGWFSKYCPADAIGIDIGCGSDPVHDKYDRWDEKPLDHQNFPSLMIQGDAKYMGGVADNFYDVVYSSHLLEHIDDPGVALENWYRILKPGGRLIVLVPHKMLYEKSDVPPSRWNGDHRHFWLPDIGEPPHTRGLRETIAEALPDAIIEYVITLDEGFKSNGMDQHSVGEYSIEAVVRKPTPAESQGKETVSAIMTDYNDAFVGNGTDTPNGIMNVDGDVLGWTEMEQRQEELRRVKQATVPPFVNGEFQNGTPPDMR